MNDEKIITGIIITGKKEYTIPADVWNEELQKITDRLKEKDGENWSIRFIYEKSLENTPLLSHLKSLEEDERVEFSPVTTDWLRYKENSGWKRDQKMVELGNYCLCFALKPEDIQNSSIKYLLKAARKERLIVREIYEKEEEKKTIKPIIPGSLTLNL